MDTKEYYELQEKTIKENKESYEIKNDVRYINIVNCNNMYWNASSICEILSDDLEKIDNRINYLSYSKLCKMLCRIINTCKTSETDKKVKDWIIRNYKTYLNKQSNRELNKMIRNNYVFYYKNKHSVLYKS